jgi:hypothetical protein
MQTKEQKTFFELTRVTHRNVFAPRWSLTKDQLVTVVLSTVLRLLSWLKHSWSAKNRLNMYCIETKITEVLKLCSHKN